MSGRKSPDRDNDPGTILPSEVSGVTGWDDSRPTDQKSTTFWGRLFRLFDHSPASEHERGRQLRTAVRAQDLLTVKRMLAEGVGVNAQQEASLACIAARRGNLELLDLLIHAGVDISKPDRRGKNNPARTALQEAARRGWLEGVELLLNHGAAPDDCEPGDFTALHLATRSGHAPVVRLLLTGVRLPDGSQPHADPSGDRHAPASPLHEVASRTIQGMLLSAGALPNARDRNRASALHQQAYHGRPELIDGLLTVGADPWMLDRKGRPPLFVLGRRGDPLKSYRLLRDALEASAKRSGLGSALDFRPGAPGPFQDGMVPTQAAAPLKSKAIPAWLSLRDQGGNTLAHALAHRAQGATGLPLLEQVFEDSPHLWALRNSQAQTPMDILNGRGMADWASLLGGRLERLGIRTAPPVMSITDASPFHLDE